MRRKTCGLSDLESNGVEKGWVYGDFRDFALWVVNKGFRREEDCRNIS
jgi:hypothetical protein